jgi:CubicO group peptidase (beta-lactamase class C family)|tara:strand:- start:3321 stop:4649 length:1329 start_codon:yes stop_codon:yes gene_type:complete
MIINRFIILFVGIMTLVYWSCRTSPEPDNIIKNKNELDQILNQHITDGSYPFLYAHIENIDGDILYQHGTVNKDLFPALSVNKDTWIRIWSMSKIVTITIIMDLVEENIIQLNDPVLDYIPEFSNLKVAQSSSGVSLSRYTNADFVSNPEMVDKNDACPIILAETDSIMRITHLINHRAGFYYADTRIPCLDSLSYKADIPNSIDSENLIKTLSTMPLIQHPGERYHYGLNTTVLGLVAERATGKTLGQLVKERITKPCNIPDFQYKLPKNKKLISPVTGRDGYLRLANPGELDIMGRNVPKYDPRQPLFLGGEGMLATADSYADFLRLLLNNGKLNHHRFLNKETLEKMFSNIDTKDEYGISTGFGLFITGEILKKYGKGDSGLLQGGGYESTSFWIDPKRKFVGLLMTQANQSPDKAGLGSGVYDKFRGALYRSFFNEVN